MDRSSRLRFSLALLLFPSVFAAGCGSSSNEGPPPAPPADAGTEAGSGSACAENLEGDVIRLSAHAPIAPGEDLSYCRRYTTPEKLDITRFVGSLGPGGHHSLLLVRPAPTEPDGLAPCSEVELMDAQEGGPFQLLAGVSYETDGVPFVFPSSPVQVGLTVPKGAQLVFDAHFLNAGVKNIDACATIDLERGKPIAVALEFRTILPESQYDLVVPAHGSVDVAYEDAPMAGRYRVVAASSHMHEGGKHFRMSIVETGQTLYETTVWSEPAPAIYDKAVVLIEKGQTIRLECSFENTSATDQRFPDQMCVGAMYVLPWP
jgi:hypothetical protein